MKKSVYGVLLIFIGLVFLSSIQSISNENNFETDHVPQLSSYTVLDQKIHINDNWTETVAAYDWITGNGIEADPYIIDGISIDMRNFPNNTHCNALGACDDYTGPAITIENTNRYFIIQNSNISYTGGFGALTSGIYIYDSRNGIILNNTFYHDNTGVYIRDSAFIKVIGNTILGAHRDPFNGMGDAIRILDSRDINISYNYIENQFRGIIVMIAEKNIFVGNNTVINYAHGTISEAGILFFHVNDSAIINNDLFGVAFTNIQEPTQSSLLHTSGLDSNPIQLEGCYNILVHGNRLFDMDGILIDNGDGGSDSIPSFFLSIVAVISIVTTMVIMRKIRKR